MPVPPPPPAPPPPAAPGPPPPPPPFSQGRSAPPKLKESGGGGRSALLADIHKGARLKKVTEINDRSAPIIEGDKKNGGTGNSRNAMAPPSGGLFAGGFPVLKPSGQRDATGNKTALPLPGMKGGSVSKIPDQAPKKIDLSKPIPHTVAYRAPPPRPTILNQSPLVPPPVPPSSSKPQLMPSSPIPPPYKERSAKPSGGLNVPPSPLTSHEKTKQRPLSNFFPGTPPPLPPLPPPPLPPSYPGRRSPSPSQPDVRDHPGPPPPPFPYGQSRVEDFIPPPPDIRDLPPPPPPPINSLSASARRRLSEPLPPPPDFVSEHGGAPPRPPKGPTGRPTVPPVPGHGRPQKPSAANSGGRLAPPPLPPARSPSTELSSRQQGYRPPSPRNLHHLDDFESKFPFHALEDLPPPEVYVPFEKIYPSKCPPVPSGPPPQRPQMR